MPTNFHLAPPPKMVDGLLAVPIDTQTIVGAINFDGATQSPTADVTITYIVGKDSGNPIFDLRQNISLAWLDGVNFPVSQLQSHDFGGGVNTGLRIIESVQTQGSVHQLRVQYTLATPLSELGSGYLPIYQWQAGPTLTFTFGFTDLKAGRYLETWIPANLVYDQFSIELDINILNSFAAHSVISNATVTSAALNSWHLSFPARFSALSPMLEIRPSDTVTSLSGTTVLPVSGRTITVEVWKLLSNTVSLSSVLSTISTLLADNENDYGDYRPGNKFVCFHRGSGGSGMEYDGATATQAGALSHEVFHSWYGRGVLPASQADGWWDEAYTVYNDQGANDAAAFDFTDPPIVLCSLDPYQRRTADNAYSDGFDFWKGIASMVGTGNFKSWMAEFYLNNLTRPVSTAMMEEFLVCKSGHAQVVDAFHRFVYGFGNPSPAPDLWLRDASAHTGGDQWNGSFWDSPDLWIRNADDDINIHQSPEYGQDNWFYARVRNRSTTGAAKHFVVTFNAKSFAGTEFLYPQDFLPSIAAKASFDLGPGEVKIVKAKWPRAKVPRGGTHSCVLASVISRADHPVNGKHVWEHNNLAQKNLTVVDLQPNSFILIPVHLLNIYHREDGDYRLEIWRDRQLPDYDVSIIHRSKDFFSKNGKLKIVPLQDALKNCKLEIKDKWSECGTHIDEGPVQKINPALMLTSANKDEIVRQYPNALEAIIPSGLNEKLQVEILHGSPLTMALKIAVPEKAKKGQTFKTHLVQVHSKTKQITGGIAVEVRVK